MSTLDLIFALANDRSIVPGDQSIAGDLTVGGNAAITGTLASGAITTTGVFTQTLGGSRTSTGGDESLILTNSASAGDDVVIHTTAGTTGYSKWTMGNPSDDTLGFIKFSNNTTDMTFAVGNGNVALTLDGPTLAATFAGTLAAGAGSGFGIAPTDGTLHVHTATAGDWAPSASYDDLVVENSGPGGISLATPNASEAIIAISSPATSGSLGLGLIWKYSTGAGKLLTGKVDATLDLKADNQITNLTLAGADGAQTATFAGEIILANAAGLIHGDNTANAVTIAGGNGNSDGGNIWLYGAGHAAANDVQIRSGNYNILLYDDSASEVVVNEGTQDVDFRVESDNESHMFVVDAGRDEVNITNRAIVVTDGRGLLNINADTSGTLFHLFTNQADADGANVVFEKAGATPAGNDVISKQSVRSNTADLTNVEYGYSEWRIGATTDAAQEGYWRTFIYDAGTAYNALHVSADGIVLNEDGRTRFDFRVETLNRTNMIFVDASVDTVTFNGPVFVKNSATTAYQWIDADATYDAQFILGSGGSTHARIGVAGATDGVALTGSLVNELVIQNRDGANWIHLAPTNTFTLSLDGSRNMYLNGVSTHPVAATDAVGVFHIYNGTAPSASATNGVLLYAEDVTASSELKVRDEAGNVTVLSPHNFTLIPDGPSEDMAWAHHSERDGKTINVDMLAAIREVERLSGRKLVWTE